MRRRRFQRLWMALITLLVGFAAGAGGGWADGIRTAVPFPTQGEATVVLVESAQGLPASGAQVSVVYRPGSQVESAAVLGLTDSLGQLSWTPLQPGIARLTARWSDSLGTHSPECNVSLRFGRVRADGVTVAILAGLILYGTVAFGFGRLRS